MMTSEKRTTNWDGVLEWMELNGYNPDEVETGYKGYTAEGYQDPDYIEISEDAEHAGEYHIIIDGDDVL